MWNAREHGLAGDGKTNDQPALAALVERVGGLVAADGRPRVIYCPPGVYRIAGSTTVWRRGVSLTGAGEGATRFVLESDGAPIALAAFTEQQHGASRDNALADCMFFNFEIDGSRVKLDKYEPRAKGLDLQYMVRATFRDLYIHETAATGLGCDHLKDSVIESVYVMNCGRLNDGAQPGGAGIGIGVGGWGAIERTSITDCITSGNATNGIFVELQQHKWPPPRGITISGCHSSGNRFGISDWGADGLIVSTCVMLENLESGFDVSSRGVAGVAGRGGLLDGCVIDNNAGVGVSIDGTTGPYTVRGNRISNNGRYGYHQLTMKPGEKPPAEIVLEANDVWFNGLDGVQLDRELLDSSITANRIRSNGRQCGAAVSGGGAGVSYSAFSLRDAEAGWQVDAHKGKVLSVGALSARVLGNTAKELLLAPWRPGAKTAWQGTVPVPATPYRLPGARPVRAGVSVTAPMTRLWIRGNRIWDRQAQPTQTHSLALPPELRCEDCLIDPA
jgi:hypothetical protein